MRKSRAMAGIAVLTAVFAAGYDVQTDLPRQSVADLYQAALMKAEAEGDLNGAIKLFEALIAKFPDARELAAKSQLQVGAWARDAIALEIPDQILCRPDCAGLCQVCGEDLNVEPHEHADTEPDPRWAALAELRKTL